MNAEPRLEQLQAGDPGTWEQVVREQGPKLVGYATRMMGDRATAEEVVQEALVAAYRSIDRFMGRASFGSFLFQVVRGKAIDELRRRKRYSELTRGDPEQGYFKANGRWARACEQWDGSADSRLDARRKLALVRRELDRLPHTHRDVLLLKEVQQLASEEVCHALDISPVNLRVRLHRARKALRAAVEVALKEG